MDRVAPPTLAKTRKDGPPGFVDIAKNSKKPFLMDRIALPTLAKTARMGHPVLKLEVRSQKLLLS
jgi:hypothetical protein